MDKEFMDEFEKMSGDFKEKLDNITDEQKKFIETAEANSAALVELEKANAVAGARITELKDFLTIRNGKSGEQDFDNLFGKWVRGCWEHKRYGQVSEENQIDGYTYEQKALDSTTPAAAGYLVPEVMAATLYAAKDIYGHITPLMAKMTLPAGQTALINRENAKPVAQFRVAGQNAPIPLTDPTYEQETVNPMLVGSLITVSNELLSVPGVNYTGTVAPQMLRAIVLAEEDAFLKGVGGTDSPTSGILSTAGVIQGGLPIGGDTLQDWIAFISDAAGAINHLYRTTETVILTTPARVYALAATASGINIGQALSWADPVSGVPGRIIGYPFFGHPGMFTTEDEACMFNPMHFLIANSGQMAVDVNPLGEGFRTNSSDIRVFTHTDFTLNNPAWYFKNKWT